MNNFKTQLEEKSNNSQNEQANATALKSKSNKRDGNSDSPRGFKEDKIEIVDWYFPLNDEDFMEITINLNGYLFSGLLSARESEE